ncbi:MAG TPA: HAMP domain-containing sensor histidine kinase [Steroidobacteraceae bacterium]|nr:HAMP domain-containing sensor histidine kinase [Steroidobacteraceae bacterium]
MEQVQHTINEQREHTDASLDAERAKSGSREHLSEVRAQQELDDLLERDRILADARLLRLRNSADGLLARDRSASPSKAGGSVENERRIADEGKKIEREDIDAHVQEERQRSDLLVESERKRQELLRTQLNACRQDTDDRLSSERDDSDTVVVALGRTENALALSEAERERYTEILGIVTHDLRGPLFSIAMSAQAIADDTQEVETRKLAGLIAQAAARMERLTADLLDAVRIQSGTLRLIKRSQDLDSLLSEVLKTYAPLFTNRGLTFNVDMPATPMMASFDHDRIVQVLSNLLSNALKFTPRGGVVTLNVQQFGKRTEFSVNDTGLGIAPDDLPHVFERFWQIQNQTRRGLGLGLYICKTIVEGHGGTITVASELGKGTTMRFNLP